MDYEDASKVDRELMGGRRTGNEPGKKAGTMTNEYIVVMQKKT